MFFKVFNRQHEPSKQLFLHVNSLDFHLIRMPYTYTRSATPWRLTSINILGPQVPRARPGAAGVFVYPGSGVRIPGHVFQLPGSDFSLRDSNIPFPGYDFSFQVPASSIQAPISTLTLELLQYLTLFGFDFGLFLKHNCNHY